MEQTKYDVFISYSRKDYVDDQKNVISGNAVTRIMETLKESGISYWFDEEGIYSGNVFTEKIVTNIEASTIVLFLSTKNANSSPWTSKEIACADELHKYIIPVRIDHSPYNKKVLFRIADRSYIDFAANPSKGLCEIVQSVNKYKEQIEEDRGKKEEEERKRIEIERKRAEEQKKEQDLLITDIKLSCSKLNNEEAKIELERANLLLRAEKVIDNGEKEFLKKLISDGGTIHLKYQKKYNAIVKEWDDLKAELINKNRRITSLLSDLDVANAKIAYLEKANPETAPTNQTTNELTNNTKVFDVNGVSFNMILVRGGSFMMGAIVENACDDEKPIHQVSLSDFYIGETPVTQSLWEGIMDDNPSKFKDPNAPVESVSWLQCQEFINKLIILTNSPFRMPTEAEWEFAAKGGCESKGFIYSGSNDVKSVAWCLNNSDGKTHPVRQKESNELGLYDMSGNVWEWCQDRYDKYPSEDVVNPTGPTKGRQRVQRGGCWDINGFTGEESCRVSYRSSDHETYLSKRIGFRLALSVKKQMK